MENESNISLGGTIIYYSQLDVLEAKKQSVRVKRLAQGAINLSVKLPRHRDQKLQDQLRCRRRPFARWRPNRFGQQFHSSIKKKILNTVVGIRIPNTFGI